MLYTAILIAAAAAAPDESSCRAAPASATGCVAFDGGIAFTEEWEDTARWEDLTIVCGAGCRLTVFREGDRYTIYDDSGVRTLPSGASALAMVSVFGSSSGDQIDVSALRGETFAHLGGGDDTLYARSCAAVTASRGDDTVRCGERAESLSAR